MTQDSVPTSPETSRTRMGKQLRTARKACALTLKQLSALSGVALSTLSKMELGQVSVSYEKFTAVARSLNIDISQLLSHETTPANASSGAVPIRTSVTQSPDYDTGNYSYRLLAGDFPGRHMTPMVGRIMARHLDDFDDFVRHPGQEFIVVLSGKIRICFESGESLTLNKHESAYFDSGQGHIYLSLSARDAEIMVVMTPA